MILQAISDLVSIAARHGIREAILSPGSRCAPLSIGFIRHPQFHCRTISDERSAGFIAMGMAQQLDRPVVMVCTSGSAAYNYAPSVAEAYFQQIPLLILTADRPPEWIDQWDGQTIRQAGIFGNHVKKSFVLPDSFEHADKVWHLHRIINEAINEANRFPKGPVHVNIPLREPFYPTGGEDVDFSRWVQVIDDTPSRPIFSNTHWDGLAAELNKFQHILIVPGQQKPAPELKLILQEIHQSHRAVVITDLISNLQGTQGIRHPDFLLQTASDREAINPDLIISFGKSILSKALKQYLRSSEAEQWHLQCQGYVPDPFQRLRKVLPVEPIDFLTWFRSCSHTPAKAFASKWNSEESRIREKLPNAMKMADFGEFKAIYHCLAHLPSPSKLHLANSMAVRYASFLSMVPEDVEVIANRGTSGIDGSNSTAVGCALTTKEQVTLITGDLAFFYDRNAFWHNYDVPNLRIIVLNNHAGGIFRLIEGPSRLPELEEFFETKQALTAQSLAMEFNFEYLPVHREDSLLNTLPEFFQHSIRPKIIEVFSSSPENARIIKEIKAGLT
ncbi:2-succinyl-5-enolpyruvyl-6-hydroxy-3- cyclohexene-1-carboxylic-acid synthase [Lunatimonas lonarensis]|uniref:2-succinyl-5-enolpyruvyl-6-hydroxy-3-cyclohexene-1-carboxylate synthase n=1 Tax=Lunatimonas lonarensis TaxID=1232681 RepID=R7ZQN7_9BACT|nr:2-succinyl-5-enolpyruvyl-6-hydroxy-3-cyclohexene-1-carboxylic-acid synthase [Lunatimonas lonarensis]EON76436.1 2-succinyl-5-enolpyruvyl-6-hydroxy-3- cyclohexene-1-carboxylic-acid synthase [Lunatimonas lonarensis]